MADKTLEYLLKLNASGAVAGLRSATDASTALATAERAEATAARESARAQEEAARAAAGAAEQKRRATILLENLAVRGDASGTAALSYQRQIANIEELRRVTGDEALAQRALAAANKEYAGTLHVSTAATTAHAHAMTKAGVSAGSLRAGVSSLGSQFADVGVQMAMGMNPMMIAVQQGPQIAGALGMMGSAGVAAGVAVAALAVVAGAGYVAWKTYNVEADRSADALRVFGAAADEVKSVTADSTSKTIAFAVATGQLTEEQGKLAAATVKAQADTTASLQPYADAIKASQDSMKGAHGLYTQWVDDISSVNNQLAAATKYMGFLGWAPAGVAKAFDAVTTSSADLNIEIGNQAAAESLLILAESDALKVTNALIEAEADAKKKKEELAEAARLAAEASRKYAEQLRREEAAWDRWIATAVGAKDAAHALLMAKNALEMNRPGITKAQQDALMYPVTDETWAKIDAKAKEVDAERAKKAREDWIDIAIAMGAQLEESGKEAVTAVKSELFSAQGMSNASGMINQASAGPSGAIAALSAIPVYGQLIAAIVGLTDAIGKGLLDDMHEWVMGLMDTISNLPTLLSNFVEKSIMEGVPKLFKSVAGFFGNLFEDLPKHVGQIIKALIMSIGGLLRHLIDDMPTVLVKGIAAIFSPENWAEVGRSIAEAFVEAFKGIGKGPEGKGMLASGGGWWQRDFGDIAGDMILGKNREGILHDIWKGPQGKGGISNLFGLTGLVGSFDSGGYIPRTGLAMVHRGEYVSTSAETSRGQRRTSDGSGGGVTNVNIGPVYGGREAARQIADLLREHMGSNGQRLTIQGA